MKQNNYGQGERNNPPPLTDVVLSARGAGRVDEKLKKVIQRLDRFHRRQKDLKRQGKDLVAEQGNIGRQVRTLERRTKWLQDEVQALRERAGGRKSRASVEERPDSALEELIERVQSAADESNQSRERIDTTEAHLAEVEQKVQELAATSAAFTALIDEVETSMAANGGDPRDRVPRLTNVVAFRRGETGQGSGEEGSAVSQRELDKLERRLAMVEDAAADLEAKGERADRMLAELQERGDDSDEQSRSATRLIDELRNDTDQRLSELATRLQDLADGLERAIADSDAGDAPESSTGAPEKDMEGLLQLGELMLSVAEQGKSLQALRENLGELESVTSGLAAESPAAQKELTALKHVVEEQHREMLLATEDLLGQAQSMAQVQRKLRQDVDQGLGEVRALATTADADVERERALAARLAELERTSTRQSHDTADLRSGLEQVHKREAGRDARLEGLSDDLGKVQARNVHLAERIVGLEEARRRSKQAESTLATQIAAVTTAADRRQARTDRHLGALWSVLVLLALLAGAGIWSQSADVQQNNAIVRGEQKAFRQELDEQSRRLMAAAGRPADPDSGKLETEIGGLKAEVGDLKRRFAEQPPVAAAATVDSQPAPDPAQLEALSSAVAETMSVIDGLRGELAEVRGSQQAIEARVAEGERAALETRRLVAPRVSDELPGLKGEAWLMAQNPESFTVQLAAFRRASKIREVAASQEWPAEIATYGRRVDGLGWNVLLMGVYETLSEAQAAADALPERAKVGGPWIRRLSNIQEDLRFR